MHGVGEFRGRAVRSGGVATDSNGGGTLVVDGSDAPNSSAAAECEGRVETQDGYNESFVGREDHPVLGVFWVCLLIESAKRKEGVMCV